MQVKLNEIWVDEERQRKDLGNLSELKKSIENLGLLNPLIVEKKDGPKGECYKLIAGERRFRSLQELYQDGGDIEVPVSLMDELSEKEKYLVELDENIKRKELEWPEYCQALSKMYKLCQPITLENFAEQIGINRTSVGKALVIAENLDDPLVKAAKNISNAAMICSRINARKLDSVMLDIDAVLAGDDEDEKETNPVAGPNSTIPGLVVGRGENQSNKTLVAGAGSDKSGSNEHMAVDDTKGTVEVDPFENFSIEQNDFFEWIKGYQGAPFNLIHCDFPYGIKHDRSSQGNTDTYGTYADSEDIYKALVLGLLENRDKLIAPSAHVVCWLSLKFEQWTREVFSKAGFTCSVQPFIWFKSDNKGIIADPDCGMRNVGEYALIFTRNRRKVCKNISNIFAHPTTKKFHASEKPGAVLDYLFTALVDETSRVLDPTCGSGTAIHAAMRANAECALGLELDPAFAENAKTWLKIEKQKQGAQSGSILDNLEIEL